MHFPKILKNTLFLSVILFAALFLTLAAACGSSEGGSPDAGLADSGTADAGTPDAGDGGAGLPTSLNVKYTRPDVGTPLTKAEVTDFTRKVMKFLKDVRYFDYVLYTTHGVDASTGKRDWQFWYGELFKKEGDKVTFYHPVNLNDGGHNLHEPLSRVLGDLIAAYLLTGDQTAALGAEKLCKGMSASMLGMVRDSNDPVKHLMPRNIVAFNHEFLTHDGKKKGVDYSGWFSSYQVWNAYRYEFADNPYWGKVWVTNIRSKDDMPYVYRLVPILRYFVEQSKDNASKEACAEALDMLQTLGRDIVDSDYRIRTKDADGTIFIPGYTDDPELNKKQGDLASYINYRSVIPEGECNARRAVSFVGYGNGLKENCGRGQPNAYDEISFAINAYNKGICNYYHLAHIVNALVNRDDSSAAKLLDGLNERITKDENTPEGQMRMPAEEWWRDVALYLAQSHSFGFPLTSDEARLIQHYYGKAVDEDSAWPYWDPWAPAVPQGELGSYRPSDCKGSGATRSCWWRVEDLGQVFENCWSPLVNPSGAEFVDCEIVRDPAKWE